MIIGTINVDEFITVDGVIDSPTWSFDYPFEEKMGAAIGRITAASQAILLGRTTYEQFAPAWSSRTAEDDPGARSSTTRRNTSCRRPSSPLPKAKPTTVASCT
jgi:hypothetical protein